MRALHRYLYNDMSYVPSATVKNYSDQIRASYGGSVEQGDKPEAVQGGEIESDDFAAGSVAGTN